MEQILFTVLIMAGVQAAFSILVIVGSAVQFNDDRRNLKYAEDDDSMYHSYGHSPAYYKSKMMTQAKVAKIASISLMLSPLSVVVVPLTLLGLALIGIKIAVQWAVGGIKHSVYSSCYL